MKSQSYESALRAVANLNKDHPFHLGQPLWVRPGLTNYPDPYCYIAQAFYRGLFGGWFCMASPEDDPETQYPIPCSWLSDTAPDETLSGKVVNIARYRKKPQPMMDEDFDDGA